MRRRSSTLARPLSQRAVAFGLLTILLVSTVSAAFLASGAGLFRPSGGGLLQLVPANGSGLPTGTNALHSSASGTPTSGVAPLTVQFTVTAGGGTAPYRYSWAFGGSAASTAKSPSHTYQYGGNYSASVAVTDAAGHTSHAYVRVTVGTNAFRVSASAIRTSGNVPLAVSFGQTAVGGTSPYSYAWTFGDGGSATGASPSHTYSATGGYTAVVTATDSTGATAQASVLISAGGTVSGIPSAFRLGAPVGTTSTKFWSVDAQTSCTRCIDSNSSVRNFLAATPFTWVRYGQSEDECNISLDRLYSPNGVASAGCGFNLTALKTWCAAQTPHCHTVFGLPGENNNSGEDAAIASWIVHTVGFQPDYWTIGNEPTGWTHYGLAWTKWRSTDHSRATPLAYAFDVKAGIQAVSAVDPGAKFIGIEAACSCNTAWFQDVARIDGASIAAMALHNYPSTGRTSETIGQFYAPLSGPSNVTGSVASVRAAIRGQCTACGTMPLFVNEYNAGPGWAPSNYAGTYANAVFLAASVAEALRSNVTQLTVFNLESESPHGYGYALLNSHGGVGPTGLLYSELLRYLAIGSVDGGGASTSLAGVWSVVTTNDTARSLLVVNTNTTRAVGLSISGTPLAGKLGTVYSWSPSLAHPKATHTSLLNGYSIPAQGILLLDVPIVDLLAPAAYVADSDGAPLTGALGAAVAGATASLVAVGGTFSGPVTTASARRVVLG